MCFKKSFTLLLASSILITNYALTTRISNNFDGPYLGLGAAYLTATSQLDQEIAKTEAQSNLRMAGQAPQVNLLMGFGRQINSPLYLGFEGKVSYTNYQGKYVSNNSFNRDVNFEIKDSYSLLGKLGWNIKDIALIYTKAGFCSANMRLEAHELFKKQIQTTSSRKRVNGFELNFGVDFAVHSNLLIGAEFTHCHYQSMNIQTLRDNGKTETVYKIQPQTNAVGLRLTWKI